MDSVQGPVTEQKLPVAEKAKYESIVRPGAVPIPIVQEMAASEDAAKRAAGRLATAVSAGCTPQKDPEAASSFFDSLDPIIMNATQMVQIANASVTMAWEGLGRSAGVILLLLFGNATP